MTVGARENCGLVFAKFGTRLASAVGLPTTERSPLEGCKAHLTNARVPKGRWAALTLQLHLSLLVDILDYLEAKLCIGGED